MMRAAPEMSPNLDDAIVALDGGSVNGVISREQLATVRAFLEQLNDVRDVPPVLLDRAQGAALEGAYQAGVRVADESGHVLVVSLPALLGLLQPTPRPTFRGWLARLLPASPCNQDCEQGDKCPSRSDLADQLIVAVRAANAWKARAEAAEAKIRNWQLEFTLGKVAGGVHAR
jgi:hypothetical protein